MRSSSGWLTFPASSSTRMLNCSQLTSRLTKRAGLWRSASMSGCAASSADDLAHLIHRRRLPGRARPAPRPVRARAAAAMRRVIAGPARQAPAGPRARPAPPPLPASAPCAPPDRRSPCGSTATCRSPNSFTNICDSWMSSLSARVKSAASRARDLRSSVSNGQLAIGSRAVSSSGRPSRMRLVEQVEQRRLGVAAAVDVLDQQRLRPARCAPIAIGRRGRAASAPGALPTRSAPDATCRTLAGPSSSVSGPGQSGNGADVRQRQPVALALDEVVLEMRRLVPVVEGQLAAGLRHHFWSGRAGAPAPLASSASAARGRHSRRRQPSLAAAARRDRARCPCSGARRSGSASRRSPTAAPPAAARRSRTGTRRRTARTSATPG